MHADGIARCCPICSIPHERSEKHVQVDTRHERLTHSVKVGRRKQVRLFDRPLRWLAVVRYYDVPGRI